MRIVTTFALVGFLPWLLPTADADQPLDSKGTITLSLVLQDFYWREELHGSRFLEESGIIPGISIDGHSSLQSDVSTHFSAQFYAGTVDYDGYIISLDGTRDPYKSDTSYIGVVGDLDASINMADQSELQVRPFGGIGSRFWLRQLDDGGEFGYDEYWLTIYFRAGVRLHKASGMDTRWHLLAALILPVYNYEWVVNIPFAPNNDIELKPKRKPGYQLEAGINHKRWTLVVFHEGLEFGQSDPDKSGVFFQPASEMRLTGIRAGISF